MNNASKSVVDLMSLADEISYGCLNELDHLKSRIESLLPDEIEEARDRFAHCIALDWLCSKIVSISNL